MRKFLHSLRGFIVAAVLGGTLAQVNAQALLDDAYLIGTDYKTSERAFDVSAPGLHHLRLTDLGFPMPLGAVSALLAHGSNAVATLATPGTVDTTLVAGRHKVLIAAIPAATDAFGAFGISLQPAAGGANAFDFSDSAESVVKAAPELQSTLQSSFVITTPGAYHIALADLAFPATLSRLESLVTAVPSGAVVARLSNETPSADATLPAGNYNIIAFAETTAAAGAGLYGLSVTGNGVTAYDDAHPVGALDEASDLNLPTTGPYTLGLSDLSIPSALSALGAVLVRGSVVLARRDGVGSAAFATAAGPARLFVLQSPATGAAIGASYAELSDGGARIYDAVTVTSPNLASGDAVLYDQVVALDSPGNHRAELVDFDFPAAASQAELYVVQAGATLGQRSGPGNVDVNAMPGTLHLLVLATPSTMTKSSLLGTGLLAQPAGTRVAEATRAVGILLQSRSIDVATDGSYDLALTDLGFPAPMTEVALAITRGNARVASVYGSGKVRFPATAGRYQLNLLARPNTAAAFGAYGLKLEPTPPPPVVTFTSSALTARQGATVDLTWSVTGATTCTAADGWSGAKPLSGTATTAALNVDTRFSLNCVGPGGQTSKSVEVQVKAASTGGGGATQLELLVLLLLVGATQRRARSA